MTLTPTEIIRLGLEQGHSADVILASLEAGGFVVVPLEPTAEIRDAVRQAIWKNTWSDIALDAHWRAFLAARSKDLVQAATAPSEPPVPSPGQEK